MRSMRIWSVFKEGVVPEEREGNSSTRAGHVTPSFLTDDEEEIQSNINLISLV